VRGIVKISQNRARHCAIIFYAEGDNAKIILVLVRADFDRVRRARRDAARFVAGD
jgi:hypothetical protein